MTSKSCVETTCAYCGVGCGIKAEVDHETRHVKIIGAENHPSNYGKLCSKGTALGDTVDLNERMLYPQINDQRVSWDKALDTVTKGFQETIANYGPDSVAFYLSGQLLTEDYYVANKLMKGFIGSANIDTNSRLCMSSSVIGHKRAFGTDTVPGCYDDFMHAELIVLVGSNTAWCHPVLFQNIRDYKVRNPNLKIVVIDPRRTQTCDIADLHLPLALGADSWLFNGLLNHLAEADKVDHDFINTHCNHFERALSAAKDSSPSITQTAKTCGLAAEDVAQFFAWFANTTNTVTLYSQGVNQSSNGSDKVNAIINCHLATGRIGKPGMGPFSMTGQPNAMGGREVGGLTNTLASHLDFSPENVDRLNRFWQTDKTPTSPGLPAVELFDAIAEGKIKAVWIAATNPAVSLPNADKVIAALKQCPLVVVSDCIEDTDTTRLATVKLPATGWSEKTGTVTSSERCISRQRPLFEPAGEARHDWWMFSEVGKRLGHNEAFNYSEAVDIFREHAQLSGFENNTTGLRRDFDISAFADISAKNYETLNPIQWPVNSQHPKGKARFFKEGDFFTPDRRANFLAITPQWPVNQPNKTYPLRLNTGRIRDQWHTMTRTGLATQLNQHIDEPFLELHPEDANARQLVDQQLVVINSRWGKAITRLNISENVRPGECFAPMHWTDTLSNNSRIGAVVNPVVDPHSFQPESKHTPVEISALSTQWHGILLTRNAISWPATDYLVNSKKQQHWQYLLAGCNDAESAFAELQASLSTADDLHKLEYQDQEQGEYRLALIDNQQCLHAVIIIAKQPLSIDKVWLGQQFLQPLSNRARHALLSGHAAAGEDVGQIVCACFSIGEKTLKKAIQEQQLSSPEAVGQCLKAGTNCGSCIPEIKALLKPT